MSTIIDFKTTERKYENLIDPQKMASIRCDVWNKTAKAFIEKHKKELDVNGVEVHPQWNVTTKELIFTNNGVQRFNNFDALEVELVLELGQNLDLAFTAEFYTAAHLTQVFETGSRDIVLGIQLNHISLATLREHGWYWNPLENQWVQPEDADIPKWLQEMVLAKANGTSDRVELTTMEMLTIEHTRLCRDYDEAIAKQTDLMGKLTDINVQIYALSMARLQAWGNLVKEKAKVK